MRDIYTSLEDAKIEIQKRWNDDNLKKEIVSYFGGEMPHSLSEPRAILCRNIISPDHEFLFFLQQAKQLGLAPLGFEGIDDKFVTKNEDKMCLVKMAFCDEKNNIHYKKIIDIKKNDGKKFNEIVTLWGENLVDFHHRLLHECASVSIELFDDLNWYKERIGGSTQAVEYYKIYLAYFICHGVLFENFTDRGEESHFTLEIFLPAFDTMHTLFGVSPIIVPAVPENELDKVFWWSYPSDVEEIVNAVLKLSD